MTTASRATHAPTCLPQTTTFTILCGTTITFLGGFPSSARWTASSASTAASILRGVSVAGNRDFSAPLAVDLYRQGDRISTSRAGSSGRPGLVGHQGLVAERRPAFLGQVRHHRVASAAPGFRPPRGRPSAKSAVGAVSGRRWRGVEGVGEFVDLRHADVEAQPLDVAPTTRASARWAALRSGERVVAERRRAWRAGAAPAISAASPTSRQSALDEAAGALRRPLRSSITSRSGGRSDSMNQRAVSAP